MLLERGHWAHWTFNSSIAMLSFSLMSYVLNAERLVFLTPCVANRDRGRAEGAFFQKEIQKGNLARILLAIHSPGR